MVAKELKKVAIPEIENQEIKEEAVSTLDKLEAKYIIQFESETDVSKILIQALRDTNNAIDASIMLTRVLTYQQNLVTIRKFKSPEFLKSFAGFLKSIAPFAQVLRCNPNGTPLSGCMNAANIIYDSSGEPTNGRFQVAAYTLAAKAEKFYVKDNSGNLIKLIDM